MIAEIKSNAKINLHLEVLNKRSDGYHNIFSLMAEIGLFDLLKLEKIVIYDSPGKVEVKINDSNKSFSEVSSEKNLITRATEYFFHENGKSGKVEYSIEKNIPFGAGLGGGSSNAAYTIKLLKEYFKNKYDDVKDLDNNFLGFKIGADVPFCMNGKIAICEGIGEKIQPLTGDIKYNILLINNGIHIDTPKSYKILNRDQDYRKNEIFLKEKEVIREFIKNSDITFAKNTLKNDFETPAFELFPEIKNLKDDLYKYGADFATMTGSGSTMIGLFKDIKQAKAAKGKLKNKAEFILLTKFIN